LFFSSFLLLFVFFAHVVSSLAYPNLLGNKMLGGGCGKRCYEIGVYVVGLSWQLYYMNAVIWSENLHVNLVCVVPVNEFLV
jgi:hypothetical protein